MKLFKTLLLLLVTLVPAIAYSHPHSFITLKTRFITEQNKLTQLHFSWTMDELTSAYLKLESQQDAKAVFNDLMVNIFANHFFSEFWLTSQSPAKAILLMPIEQDANLDLSAEKAVVSFYVRLKQPVELKNNQFELMTFEKTFYVDMYYESSHDIEIDHPNCQINLAKPTPDDALLNYAAALDQDESPPESDDFILGKLFAQKVSLTCQ